MRDPLHKDTVRLLECLQFRFRREAQPVAERFRNDNTSRSIDPEVRINSSNFFTDPNLTNGYNQESWPQFRRFLATLRLAF